MKKDFNIYYQTKKGFNLSTGADDRSDAIKVIAKLQSNGHHVYDITEVSHPSVSAKTASSMMAEANRLKPKQ